MKKKTEQWSVSEWVLNKKCSRWFMGFKTCRWIGGSSLLCRPPSWQQWNNMISLLVFLKNRWSGSQKNRFGAEWSFQSYLLLSSNKTFFFELFKIKYWAWIYSKCLDGNKFAVLIDCMFLFYNHLFLWHCPRRNNMFAMILDRNGAPSHKVLQFVLYVWVVLRLTEP